MERILARSTLAAALVEGVLVWVMLDTPPTDEDWNAAMEFAGRLAPQCKGILVWADAAPHSAQRARIAKIDALARLPTAIVSSSAVVRGVATAFSWLGKRVKAFPPSGVDEALDFLEVDPKVRELALRRVGDLRMKLTGRVAS